MAHVAGGELEAAGRDAQISEVPAGAIESLGVGQGESELMHVAMSTPGALVRVRLQQAVPANHPGEVAASVVGIVLGRGRKPTDAHELVVR
ncbi:MAG TPA: hypothetical protein VGJ44_00450, partial [Kribbellaceae bacterium]